MKIQQHLIALLLAPPVLTNAQISVFEGNPGQKGDVVTVTAFTQLRPPTLQGVVLMSLDCVGRTRFTELRADRARLRSDVPGATRLVLPEERGSLYKYRRDDASGAAAFGYFFVRPNGMATSLFELAGTGALGTDDPLPENVAFSPDGRSFLVASVPEAGGDLWEVQLGGVVINRTSNTGPHDFGKNGLVLLDYWGAGVSAGGVLRFERAPGAVAAPVPMSVAPAWFGPDVVYSLDRSTVAFLAGLDATNSRVWTFRRFSEAVAVSDTLMQVSGAGFLPEELAGPTLALSTDGSWVAWRAQGSTSRELFVRETRPGPRAPPLQVTDGVHFHYTLNDTGVISFFDRDSFMTVVGRGGVDDIHWADVYGVDLNPLGTIRVTNLSLTSGLTQEPFDYGSLSTLDGLYQVPGGAAPAIVVLDGGGAGEMLWVSMNGGVVSFLDRVQSLDSLDVAGSYLVAAVTRPPGVDDPLLESLNLVQIPGGGAGATAVNLPDGCSLTRTVGSRTHNLFAAVMKFDFGERLGRLNVPSPSGTLVGPGLLEFGPTTGLTPDGAIVATVTVDQERAAFSWSDLGTSILRVSRGESFLLPGL